MGGMNMDEDDEYPLIGRTLVAKNDTHILGCGVIESLTGQAMALIAVRDGVAGSLIAHEIAEDYEDSGTSTGVMIHGTMGGLVPGSAGSVVVRSGFTTRNMESLGSPFGPSAQDQPYVADGKGNAQVSFYYEGLSIGNSYALQYRVISIHGDMGCKATVNASVNASVNATLCRRLEGDQGDATSAVVALAVVSTETTMYRAFGDGQGNEYDYTNYYVRDVDWIGTAGIIMICLAVSAAIGVGILMQRMYKGMTPPGVENQKDQSVGRSVVNPMSIYV